MLNGDRKRVTHWLQIMLIVGSLGLMYHDSLLTHMRTIFQPLHLNDDARLNVWPLLRYYDPSLFVDDYIADYCLNSYLPVGYRAFYRMGALWWDPRTLSKAIPYPLLLVVMAALGLSAYRLGGKAAAWATLALALSTGVFLDRMTGGQPRSFGYPVLACAAAALVYGRPFLLAACVVLGTVLYPMVGLMAGFALAAYLLLLPRESRGRAADWTFRQRVLVVAATTLVSGLTLLPNALGSRPYGPMVGRAQTDLFPEVGRGGRYSERDRGEGHQFVEAGWEMLSETIQGAGDPWSSDARNLADSGRPWLMLGVLGMILAGSALLAWREAGGRRVLLLLAAAVIGHSAAKIAAPWLFFPQRYVAYPIPILALILLPASAAALATCLGKLGQRSWARPTCVLVVCGLLLISLGGRGPKQEGVWFGSKENEEVLRRIKVLPRDAVIAGWPAGAIDDVPYFAERRVLASSETHQALHRDYILEMRTRLMAIIDAYYATDVTPLARLRDEFGVTHFLVDRRHFGDSRPGYFKPFGDRLHELQRLVGRSDLEIFRQIESAGVYDAGNYFVLDLRRLKSAYKSVRPEAYRRISANGG